MIRAKPFLVADLFCGAGGSSTGARRALQARGIRMQLVAVNHWPIAIETHQRNHPDARHYCVDLDTARPEEIVPEGHLDLLMASPECIYHSRARGGRPIHDQNRMSAWQILRWTDSLYVRRLLIENVEEFIDWGPLGANRRPLKTRKGETFRAFISALESQGYRVEWRVLNAADYGDATTRRRLFIQARRDRRRIVWPMPTHSRAGHQNLFGHRTERWRSARQIIDWSIPGRSIFARERPLAPNTIRRIAAGLKKFGGAWSEPFLVVLRNHCSAVGLDVPLPAITASGTHLALAEPSIEPMVLGQQSGAAARSVSQPLPTIATAGGISMIEPILVNMKGQSDASSIDRPAPTITAHARHLGVAEPFVTPYYGNSHNGKSVLEPLDTVTTRDRHALVQPFIVPQFGERNGQPPRTHDLTAPLPTVTSHGAGALVEPCIEGASEGSPSGRIVEINGARYRLDIRFRMLKNHELARAMGFSDDESLYEFTGTGEQITRQIGNAVPVNTAMALVAAMLEDHT